MLAGDTREDVGGAAGNRTRVQIAYSTRVYSHSPAEAEPFEYRTDWLGFEEPSGLLSRRAGHNGERRGACRRRASNRQRTAAARGPRPPGLALAVGLVFHLLFADGLLVLGLDVVPLFLGPADAGA